MQFEEFKDYVQQFWADMEAYVEDVALIIPANDGVRMVQFSTPEQTRGMAMSLALHALASLNPRIYAIIVPNGERSREGLIVSPSRQEGFMLSIITSGVDVPHWVWPNTTPTIGAMVAMALEGQEAKVLAKHAKLLAGLQKEVAA